MSSLFFASTSSGSDACMHKTSPPASSDVYFHTHLPDTREIEGIRTMCKLKFKNTPHSLSSCLWLRHAFVCLSTNITTHTSERTFTDGCLGYHQPVIDRCHVVQYIICVFGHNSDVSYKTNRNDTNRSILTIFTNTNTKLLLFTKVDILAKFSIYNSAIEDHN